MAPAAKTRKAMLAMPPSEWHDTVPTEMVVCCVNLQRILDNDQRPR